MKKYFALFLVVVALTWLSVSSIAQTKHAAQNQKPDAITEMIQRGAPLGDSPKVALADLIGSPQKYTGKPVIVEGVIRRVCQAKGCWMELSTKPDATGMRVTFKDYKFFVPTTSAGLHVKAEGILDLKVLSKEKADHYASEGAKIDRNADGTANELSFVATGVELSK